MRTVPNLRMTGDISPHLLDIAISFMNFPSVCSGLKGIPGKANAIGDARTRNSVVRRRWLMGRSDGAAGFAFHAPARAGGCASQGESVPGSRQAAWREPRERLARSQHACFARGAASACHLILRMLCNSQCLIAPPPQIPVTERLPPRLDAFTCRR
jgi:hypothetical protein